MHNVISRYEGGYINDEVDMLHGSINVSIRLDSGKIHLNVLLDIALK